MRGYPSYLRGMTQTPWSKVLYAGLIFLVACLPFYRVGFPIWVGVVVCGSALIASLLKTNGKVVLTGFLTIVTAYYLSELIWLIGSDDLQNSLQNLLMKLPLLIIPASIFVAGERLNQKKIDGLWIILIASTLIASASMLVLAIGASKNDEWNIFYSDLAQWVHPGYYAMLIALVALVVVFARLDIGISKPTLLVLKTVLLIGLLTMLVLLSGRMQLIAIAVVAILLGLLKLMKTPSWKSGLLLTLVIAIFGTAGFGLINYNERAIRMVHEFKEASIEPGQSLNSVETRLVVWNLGLEAIMEQPMFGHGNADTKALIAEKAVRDGHDVIKQKSIGAHNQYLDAWITKGIFGAILMLALVCYPLYLAFKEENLLVGSITVILGLSMLTESVLEREMGVLMFSIFIPLSIIYHRTT